VTRGCRSESSRERHGVDDPVDDVEECERSRKDAARDPVDAPGLLLPFRVDDARRLTFVWSVLHHVDLHRIHTSNVSRVLFLSRFNAFFFNFWPRRYGKYIEHKRVLVKICRQARLSVCRSVRRLYCGKTADLIWVPFGLVSGVVERCVC